MYHFTSHLNIVVIYQDKYTHQALFQGLEIQGEQDAPSLGETSKSMALFFPPALLPTVALSLGVTVLGSMHRFMFLSS